MSTNFGQFTPSASPLATEYAVGYATAIAGGERRWLWSDVRTLMQANLGTLAALNAAPAGTLTGTVLASNVVTSSLTALGTIATGVWQGTAIADSYISSAATWNAKQSAITFGTGVQTALGINIGSAGAPVLFNGALGTPSSGTVTNLTGTASININGTVGAGGANTGAFTQISTSGSLNTALLISNTPTGSSLNGASFGPVMTLNQNNGTASGLRITPQTVNAGAFTGLASYALYISQSAISLANSYGCFIEDVAGSTNNYALYTGLGVVRIGDTTEATTGAAGSVVTLGGVYSTKKIISATGITALGTFDLGNASDTTLARVSAGVVSIEGATIYTQGGALGTPASGTVTNLTGTASININGTVGATTPTTGGFSTIQIAASGAANGSLLIGTSSALSSFAGTGATAQLAGTALLARAGMWGFSNDATAPGLTLTKSRNTTIGSQTVLQSGDVMGQVVFAGSDGTNYLRGALIQGRVSGSPSTGLLTGNVVISTSTADAFVDILTVSPTGAAVTGSFSATRGITKRVVTASDATSITPNSDNADITYQANTQAAGTLTINADGGTPTNGQPWVLKVKCTNAQTFSWNGIFVGGTVALPTTTTGSSKIDYYSFLYDTVGPKWHFVGNALGF